MYFKRKIDKFLNDWKNNPSHKPLIVKGARQIGKTESILHFANENYSNVIYRLHNYLANILSTYFSKTLVF